jgi:chemotaxis protein CheX
MKVEFVEPFVSAAFTVLETLTGDKPERGQLSLRTATFTSQQVSIMAGVNGEIEGAALYAMSIVTAQKIAGAMMGGVQVNELDEMALSAVSELGNMITGNATTLLSKKGYDIDITPPSVIRGNDVAVSTRVPAIVVPMNTGYGCVEINIALIESKDAKTKAA